MPSTRRSEPSNRTPIEPGCEQSARRLIPTRVPALSLPNYVSARSPRHVSLGGTPSLLASLAERHRLGIVTNGLSEWQEAKLRHHDIADAFDAVICSYDVGAHKPDPAPFEAVRRPLDVDIEGAREAGFVPLHLASDAPGIRVGSRHFRRFPRRVSVAITVRLYSVFSSSVPLLLPDRRHSSPSNPLTNTASHWPGSFRSLTSTSTTHLTH